MNSYFMGLDYGTGGCKVCIINEKADVLAYAYRKYDIITNQDNYSEHDVHDYWPATCSMIKECMSKADVKPEDIRGIGTSSALPSLVMVDKEGEPVHNAYNLMDRRADRQEQWLKEHIGADEIFRLTGNRIEDHPILVNLLWEKENRPEDYKRIYKALTIDGYIRMKLTGRMTAHHSAGVFYGVAYDLDNNRFDEGMLRRLGIEASVLPEFFRCEDIVGEVTGEAAKETGLVPGIEVAGGQVDCNAGWIGAGATEVGDIQMNLGTCGNMGIVRNTKEKFRDMFNLQYTTDCTNTYITVTTTQTGGQCLRYMKENFAKLETAMEELIPDFDSYDYLNMEADKIPPGSEGLVVLPYLMGERTPIWDNDARGVVFGLSLYHTKAHLVRAMMEGVAYALYDSFIILKESGIKINYPLVMNEGGAKSRLWRRIITDVLNVPTVFVKNRVGAPYGDALLAAVATGCMKDFSIAKEKAEYVEPMEPIEENHETYMKYFKIYRNLYRHVKEDFKDLKELRKQV
ncbi:FGGY-family carbohydrate kinase [[Clostridium] hylemonae]|uniref:Carbohydrate kinase, FGGY family protein n=1 Tax=[Clostridium] hylemonae DSM 15053 TaxID=553973 RepID=C0C1I1_9FIRM|nr:FGGY-family carbohydrate kinase [[Clostridium] hylemonae]EEG73995.1 carbohydrate kinase, FGGY family protein [[Clostridium] hylemonae DSM 15053]QEK19384.1 Xylulose kinase [[Clostridium] hylemonae DSM 15053]